MKRQVLYSGSRRPSVPAVGARRPAVEQAAPESAPASPSLQARLGALARRHAGLLRFIAGGVFAILIAAVYLRWQSPPPAMTQERFDAAVLHTLENRMLPSRAAKAAEIVRPSVVRVNGFADPAAIKGRAKDRSKRSPHRFDPGKPAEKKGAAPPDLEQVSLGSGVVIVDDGTILTNLHVVYGAKRVTVTFHDGSESEAALVSAHPENDLAVIKALKIHDDLPAATLGSAARLKPGEEVVAVGFPFGMGPSVSMGVVSGLNREFRSPEGEKVLTRLIQFDAAANPGSSGGPLITMQGDVVGIVTAIMNPTEAGTFVGIGFAVTIGAAGRAVGMHPF